MRPPRIAQTSGRAGGRKARQAMNLWASLESLLAAVFLLPTVRIFCSSHLGNSLVFLGGSQPNPTQIIFSSKVTSKQAKGLRLLH